MREGIYRTRAIISRGLYFFYPIFHCGLYFRAAYTAERLIFLFHFFIDLQLVFSLSDRFAASSNHQESKLYNNALGTAYKN